MECTASMLFVVDVKIGVTAARHILVRVWRGCHSHGLLIKMLLTDTYKQANASKHLAIHQAQKVLGIRQTGSKIS